MESDGEPQKGDNLPKFDLQRVHPLPFSKLEFLRFAAFTAKLILGQAWEDVKRFKWYRPVLSSDALTHYVNLPIGRHDPRIVISCPGPRTTVRIIPKRVTRQYEELPSNELDKFPSKEIINLASANYGGFAELEEGLYKVLKLGLESLPFSPSPTELENIASADCAAFMGFEACTLTPSGFSTNILAFATVASVAMEKGQTCLFLCDADSHISMLAASWMNQGAETVRFKHDDLTDLEFKLRTYRDQSPDVYICVCIEGIYSMEGSITAVPAVIALKRIYNFTLLIDEAHSFLALGSAGKGSLNHWQDAGYNISSQDVDVMTCMLGKSGACVGGLVLANGSYAEELRKKTDELRARGDERLASVVILRVLSLIRSPLLLKRRMRMLKQKATYVATELRKSGCRVLSSPGSATICFAVGSVRQSVQFIGNALEKGIALAAAVPPATTLWSCRIRLCIAATIYWEDIHEALRIITEICEELRVPGVARIGEPQKLHSNDVEDQCIRNERIAVQKSLMDTINRLRGEQSKEHTPQRAFMAQTAAEALRKYGIGAGGPRWYYGSFDALIKLERQLSTLYPSLLKYAGTCRAMTFSDADMTIGNAIASSALPHVSPSIINVVFLPHNAPVALARSAILKKAGPKLVYITYNSIDDIPGYLAALKPGTYYAIIYAMTFIDDISLDLFTITKSLMLKSSAKLLHGVRMILDDRHGLGRMGPNNLGYLDMMEAKHGTEFLKKTVQRSSFPFTFLFVGSWFTAFGHAGGYLLGDAQTVESLSWNMKAVMFSTSAMPMQAVMSGKALAKL